MKVNAKQMSQEEKVEMMNHAIGRLFGMMQRPFCDGDDAEYHRLRGMIMELSEASEQVEKTYFPGWNFGTIGTGCVD